MSAFAGIFLRDGRPATSDSLSPAIASLAPFGGDTQTLTAEGSVALVHVGRHTTPESLYEAYPLRSERGDWLVADARIDNRAELLRILRINPTSDQPITDADLILAAHLHWGEDAPVHLIGDFAYAFWDASRNVLFLVRSPFGPKLLFYRVTAEGIYFSSFMPALQAIAPQGLTENSAYLANFLTLDLERFHDETLFNEIAKVPHAHYVRWSPDSNRAEVHNFWKLTLTDQYEHLSDDDWRDLFRTTFEEAVATRLRSHFPISIAVSGGIDSSAISSIAHRLMHKEGRVPAQPTFLYTDRMLAWPDTSEGNYRDLLIDTLPHFKAAWVDIPHCWTWEIVERWNRLGSSPYNLSSAFWCDYRIDALRADGARIMLNGMAGDFLAGEEDYFMPEALYSLPLSLIPKELKYFFHQTPRGALKFAKSLTAKHLPPAWFRWIERTRGQPQLYTDQAFKDGEGKVLKLPSVKNGTILQRRMSQVMVQPLYTAPFEQMGEIMAAHGIEHRFPFYHRPLVELFFHIPHHLRRHDGHTRTLLKRALANDFPPELLQRNSKAGFSRFMAFSPTRPDHDRAVALPASAISLKRGWLDMPSWQHVATLPTNRPMSVIFAHRVAHMEQWRSTLLKAV